jgi:1-phosphofructokinase family hexose kinase
VIVAITPNPAIDRTAAVAEIVLDTVLRPERLLVLPGGKGVNVARAAGGLGVAAATCGFAGGLAGRWLVEALERDGLRPHFVEIAGETRTTYVTVEPGGRSLLLYEEGAAITDHDVDALLRLLDTELLPHARLAVLAGSMPPGAADDAPMRLVAACRAAGVLVLLDTSGAALPAALAAGPDIVKVNLEEAAELAGAEPGVGLDGAADAARFLITAGAGMAVVTAGAAGAVAWDGTGGWSVTAPQVAAVSTVGSGDAFTAGLVAGLHEGHPLPDCLAQAAATGAANAAALGAGVFEPALQRQLLAGTQVRPVPAG